MEILKVVENRVGFMSDSDDPQHHFGQNSKQLVVSQTLSSTVSTAVERGKLAQWTILIGCVVLAHMNIQNQRWAMS